MKVLNFGSLNLDYVYQVESILIPGETQASKSRQTFCGGKGLNQSIALAKAGIPVYHAGLIGEGGEPLLEVCKENGVNAEFIRQIPGPCGHTVIQVDREWSELYPPFWRLKQKYDKGICRFSSGFF